MFFSPYIGHVILPTDEVIFFRGVGQPPTRLLLLTIINHIITIIINSIFEGSLEVKLPTIWRDEKQSREEAERRERLEERRSEEKESEERRCRCAKR